MMNRIVSFGVLLFLFSLALLGFQPKGESITYTINIPVFSIEHYRVMGMIAIALSLIFLITAIRREWSEWAERILDRREIFFPVFVIFWFLYTISYIKGFAGIVETSPPAWLADLVFYFGFAVFLFLAMMGLRRLWRT